ncbi:helix-turn-helix domain-containing protein [Amycolatopsis lurida]
MDDFTNQPSDLPAAVRQLAEAVHTLAAAAQRDPDALLTAEQVGELLGLSPRTLKEQAAARVFPHRRFGKHYRFSRDDITEMVRQAGCAPRPYSLKEKRWPTAS